MVIRDKITKITSDKISDGMGGFDSQSETLTDIECKASLNTSPEVAAAFGLSREQVLYVVTKEELDKEAFYLFNDMKFSLRFQTKNNRFYFSTLIEVKKGEE
jgi:hypothetical protein